MSSIILPKKTTTKITSLVKLYVEKQDLFERFAKQVFALLGDHKLLKELIHSLKYRVKDPEHLQTKLVRKAKEAIRGKISFNINNSNLFSEIDDLAGVRLLHLHTTQMKDIDKALREIIDEEQYTLISGPVANTWDNEYRDFFKNLSMEINERDTMYTSVHYVIGSNNKYQTRCEIQVRTLMEEVWGEVSHTIDYPVETESIACREQIKVLARVTSSCTRLVDSIFKSNDEHKINELTYKKKTKKKKKKKTKS